jgi:hypothetical protein
MLLTASLLCEDSVALARFALRVDAATADEPTAVLAALLLS